MTGFAPGLMANQLIRIGLLVSAVSLSATLTNAAAQSTECIGGPAGASSFLLSFETQQERVRIIMNESAASIVAPYRISGDRVFFEAGGRRFHFDPDMRILTIGGEDLPSGHAHCSP